MKRLVIAFLAMGALMLAATGCKNSNAKSDADSLTLASVDATTAGATFGPDTLRVDSVTYMAHVDSTVESTIYVDFPRGNDAFSQAVKEFIGKQLASLYIPYYYGDDTDKEKYPHYHGSVSQAQKMVDFYGKGALKYLVSQQREMVKALGWSDRDKPSVYSQVEIRKASETPTYVVYHMDFYGDTGGAHGSFTYYAINISKLTNRPIEKTVDENKLRALQPLLRKGILKHFETTGDKGITEANLLSFLQLPLDSKDLIPLPAYPPCLENDSVRFVYQQYEIASYFAGLVSFNIAYKDIRPFLRKEVLDLMDH